MLKNISVAIPAQIDTKVTPFLIREDGQEDLMFALWTPSYGQGRLTALIHTPVFPEPGERQVHGNVSFNPVYLKRVRALALEKGCGIAFLHSHPSPGWQGMSEDDILAESGMAGSVISCTELPLVGMTIGSDRTWSARMWEHQGGKVFNRRWCHSVRIVGKRLKPYFCETLAPKPKYQEMFKRTVTVWGEDNHANLARLRIGIVGLGSVGSMVAEALARMGMENITLIDFDEVQPHNLDRLLGASTGDVGQLKVDVAQRQIHLSSTAHNVNVYTIPYSLAEKEGYQAALDCDVLFSCVDRPRARHILNHFSYAHLIPVIDGGIGVVFNKRGKLSNADWQVMTVGPERPCLECLGQYDIGDVSTEENGLLDDPTYMKGLPDSHRLKRNENVFPFSANLASLEVFHLIALVTAAAVDDFGVQRFRYNPGMLDFDIERVCNQYCKMSTLVAQGDRDISLFGRDHGAEKARERQG